MKRSNEIRPLWLNVFELEERRRMRERDALADALGFIDRLQHSKDDGWTAADVQRINEIQFLSGQAENGRVKI